MHRAGEIDKIHSMLFSRRATNYYIEFIILYNTKVKLERLREADVPVEKVEGGEDGGKGDEEDGVNVRVLVACLPGPATRFAPCRPRP